MQIRVRTMVLASLLAPGAMAVRAQPTAAEATPPINAATTQQTTLLDLSLHPAAAPKATPIDIGLHPVATPQSTPSGIAPHPAATQQLTPIDLALHPAAAPQSGPIEVTLQSASEEVKRVARWVVDTRDNVGLPYLLIDKANAQVFAFTPGGQLQGATPALLGMARGDRLLAPNNAPMSAMSPQVRITPAGRFVSRLAIDSLGKELLVLDYDAAISLHAVVKGTPKEHRAERLQSATSQDNRISFGCINVPAPFYAKVVSPAFTGSKGIVYVLPETSPASALFGFQAAGAAVASGTQAGTTTLDARPAQRVSAPTAR